MNVTNMQQVTPLPEQIPVLVPQEGHHPSTWSVPGGPGNKSSTGHAVTIHSWLPVSEPPEVLESVRERPSCPLIQSALLQSVISQKSSLSRLPQELWKIETEPLSKANRPNLQSQEGEKLRHSRLPLPPLLPFLSFIMWAWRVRKLTAAVQFHFIP